MASPPTVLALLVFALGQLATEGIFGPPITNVSGAPSGIRGGAPLDPAGLELFNEARARIGSIAFHSDLVNVQILLLQASYFEANACHMEYWRSTVAASMSCQTLVQFPPREWASLRGDLIKRAYWVCFINEDIYHLDLDCPRTTIGDLEESCPLPHFPETIGRQMEVDEGTRGHHSHYHFLAKIGLKGSSPGYMKRSTCVRKAPKAISLFH